MAKTNPFAFIQEVRNEVSKVTWPTRKEAGVTTVMVLIFVFVAMLFLASADQLLAWGIGLIFGIAA